MLGGICAYPRRSAGRGTGLWGPRMSFPDLPFIPDLPGHRVENMTVPQVLGQASAALHAARGALHDLAEPVKQFETRVQDFF